LTARKEKLMRIKLPLALLMVVALLAGCSGGNATPVSTPSSNPSYHELTLQPVRLDFTVTATDGQKFAGSSLAGKPAVVWFWAPWCPICADQIEGVKAFAKKYGGRVTIVGVGGLDKAAAIRKGPEVIPDIPNLVDPDGVVWRDFSVTSQATLVVLDATSRPVWIEDSLSDQLELTVKQLAG
jgi:thiol-disulfide isomerase/thioredoxin